MLYPRKNPEAIGDFIKYRDDQSVIDRVRAIKHENKERFAEAYYKKTGDKLDTHSLFDVQVKRIHEYKRQLLNALKIVALYDEIKKYVAEHNAGMKVSNLYISQVKRKCGIEVGKNYNLPKNEDSRQPQCPEDKESAIVEALKHFKMNS